MRLIELREMLREQCQGILRLIRCSWTAVKMPFKYYQCNTNVDLAWCDAEYKLLKNNANYANKKMVSNLLGISG
jgi:hypothetical protein